MRYVFNKIGKSEKRHGRIKTVHGVLKTPAFLPDATRGFIKTLSNEDLARSGVGAMVVNTYHLFLQPGIGIIKKAKGIHNFTGWNRPLVSDSGGFQIFSLIRNTARKNGKKPLGKISEEGVYFKSPVNGSEQFLSPEKSIEIQFELGTDMIVALDDCPPNNSTRAELGKSIERTVGWAERCFNEYIRQINKRKIPKNKRPLIISVIQGGGYKDLRKACYRGLESAAGKNKNKIIRDWDGFGFGARPVDAKGKFLKDTLGFTASLIPEEKIRFGLGIGSPRDIWECAKMGWDVFDCVIPTREGRHGKLYLNKKEHLINEGKIHYNTVNISSSKFAKSFKPINAGSGVECLKKYSRAYLKYLLKSGESLGARLASMNNLKFYSDLMAEIRDTE
ncbi:MAG: tRNA guanosine(34) transglycosylase Tgt [Patescibacteria group bacterium]|jgi:queuine tRNA-ribosyltransferase